MTNAGAPYTCPITRPWQKSLRPPIVYRSPSPPRGDGRKPCTRPLLPNTCPRHRAVKETLRFVSIPATPATRCYEALHPSTPSEYPPPPCGDGRISAPVRSVPNIYPPPCGGERKLHARPQHSEYLPLSAVLAEESTVSSSFHNAVPIARRRAAAEIPSCISDMVCV